MYIKNINIDGYKNLNNININLHEKLNILCGENAQGKTNIIESIWLCSGCRSFRGTKDKDFIDFQKQQASFGLSFQNTLREQIINININKKNIKNKNITLNGVPQKYMSNLFGNLKCVIFTPEDLELSKGSPENRRTFIDLCIAQIKTGYNSIIQKYENVLLQRNTLLKNISAGISKKEELFIWNEQLANLGSYITVLRNAYIKKLCVYANKLHLKISDNKENLDVYYNSTIYKPNEIPNNYDKQLKDKYLDILNSQIDEDIKYGFTQSGIHRDDVITKINNLSTREYCSQGQQRSVALILKLSEAYILANETSEAPVILLDDVLSELDNKRQKFVLSSINNMQVIITCCKIKSFSKNFDGKIFIVKNGSIVKKEGK